MIKWDTLYANKLGCHCQGIGMGPTSTQRIAGTNTFFLVDYHDILSHKCKEICHTMVVCKVCSEKVDLDCTHITTGGNRICYPGNIGTNTASIELIKLILNSVLSRKGDRLSTIDLKNFYLVTPMPDPEYGYPRQIHPGIQPLGPRPQWLDILQNLPRLLRSSPNRHPCQQSSLILPLC
jgi:hypothetical protein